MTLKRGLYAAGVVLGVDVVLSYVAGMIVKDTRETYERRKFAMGSLVLGQTVLGLPAALALLYGSGPYA